MIRYEPEANPWPVFVRDIPRGQGFICARGHGLVVGRRMMDGRFVLSYDVRMDDGALRECTLDQFFNPLNVAARMICAAPLTIPAPPHAASALASGND